jgi:hypothetical protein
MTTAQPSRPAESTTGTDRGLTLRDLFAAMMLQALVSKDTSRGDKERTCELAWNYADEMIRQRNA